MKKPPPKIGAGAQAKGSNPRQSVVLTPKQQLRTTKSKSNKWFEKQKTRQLAKRNWRVLKEFCWLAYHDLLFVGKRTVWITGKYHDELIRIVLLIVASFLEYHLDATLLFHH